MEHKNVTMAIETITPQIARDYLRTNTFNRRISGRNVELYASAMKRGQWILNGETIVFASNGRLMDGQTRLSAIIKSNTPIDIIVVRGIDPIAFDTLDQGKQRTPGDLFSILNIRNANVCSSIINKYILLSSGSMVLHSLSSRIEANATKRDLINIYNERPMFWDEISDFSIKCRSTKKLMKTSLIGGHAAYLILDKKHNKDYVFSFFRQFVGEENVTNTTITLLRNKIIDASLNGVSLDEKYVIALLIKTFNAFITNKEYRRLSFNDISEEYPVYI
jgi:hypothetical protein